MKLKRYLFLVGFLVLVVGFFWARSQIFSVKQDRKFIPFQLAEVKKGDIFSRISTTGTLNPVLSVTVSTQVSGTIKELLVDVNSEVEKGQIIARLDQDLFRAAVLQARAKLEDALANRYPGQRKGRGQNAERADRGEHRSDQGLLQKS